MKKLLTIAMLLIFSLSIISCQDDNDQNVQTKTNTTSKASNINSARIVNGDFEFTDIDDFIKHDELSEVSELAKRVVIQDRDSGLGNSEFARKITIRCHDSYLAPNGNACTIVDGVTYWVGWATDEDGVQHWIAFDHTPHGYCTC